MSANSDNFQGFLELSSVLTGFNEFQLRGTGQAEPYASTVRNIVGTDVMDQLVAAWKSVASSAGDDESALDDNLRRDILSDDKLGPVARNIIKLWYTGIWHELPREWRERFGESDQDRTFMVSPEAYTEGLLWPAVGANPSGAKPAGYGMWARPPHIEVK